MSEQDLRLSLLESPSVERAGSWTRQSDMPVERVTAVGLEPAP